MSTDYLNLIVKLLKKINKKNNKKFVQAAKYFYNSYKKKPKVTLA